MGDGMLYGPLAVGAIHKMVTGQEQELGAEVSYRGLIDVIDLPEELGGGTQGVTGVAVLPTCPLCGDVEDKPALILETLRVSECLSCRKFLWYQPA